MREAFESYNWPERTARAQLKPSALPETHPGALQRFTDPKARGVIPEDFDDGSDAKGSFCAGRHGN
ncbi:MAG: hypothetical protein ABSG41_16665 [Bryobacteraceae bacterium]|jgi:hypothetical protein